MSFCRLTLLLLVCIATACQTPKEIPVIDFEEALQNQKEVYLSDLAINIEYVTLKTPFNLKPRSDFGKAIVGDKVILYQSEYYHRIFIFDRQGNYVHDIGGMGNLPHQFTRIRKFCDLSPNEELVLVTDQSQIKLFNVNGQFIKTGSLPKGKGLVTRFLGNNNIVFYQRRETMEQDGYQIFIYNLDLQQTDSMFWAKASGERLQMSTFPSENFYRANDNVYFRPCEQDTLYQILPSGDIEPAYVFKLGDKKPPVRWIPITENKYVNINSITESKRFYFVNTEEIVDPDTYDSRYETIIYDKINRLLYSAKKHPYKWANSITGKVYEDSLNVWDDMDGVGYYGLGVEDNMRNIFLQQTSYYKDLIESDTIFSPKLKSRKYIDELKDVINVSEEETAIVRIVHFDKPAKKSRSTVEPSPALFTGFSPIKSVHDNHQWTDAEGLAGQTYDSSDDTFWMAKYLEGIIEHRNRKGDVLPDSFTLQPKLRPEAITYAKHDNSLWISNPRTKAILHYDKKGNDLGDGFTIDHSSGAYGITYDPSDSTLWLKISGNMIWHYLTTGERLNEEIDVRQVGCNNGRGLVYDPRDNSLWIVNSIPNKMIHFSKEGKELSGSFYFDDSLRLPDGVALDHQGFEFWIADYGRR